jgi:hypothetical protein
MFVWFQNCIPAYLRLLPPASSQSVESWPWDDRRESKQIYVLCRIFPQLFNLLDTPCTTRDEVDKLGIEMLPRVLCWLNGCPRWTHIPGFITINKPSKIFWLWKAKAEVITSFDLVPNASEHTRGAVITCHLRGSFMGLRMQAPSRW